MAKGQKTGGRKKGSQNKITKDLKAAIMGAFQKVGGEDYLVKVANENTAVFLTLLGKIVPHELTGKDGGPLQTEDVGARELARRLAFIIAKGAHENAG